MLPSQFLESLTTIIGFILQISTILATEDSSNDLVGSYYQIYWYSQLISNAETNTEYDTASSIQLEQDIPDEITEKLQPFGLDFHVLPSLLQRALIWDTGYALGDDGYLATIYTRCLSNTSGATMDGGAALLVTGIAVFVYLRRRSDRRETNLQNAAAHQLSLICSNDSNKETNESRKPRDNPLIEKEDRFGNRRSINDFLEMLSSSPSAWESSPLSLSLAQTAESLASGSPNGAKLTDSSVLYALANDPHLKNAQIPFELLQFHHLIARSSRSEVWLCVLRDRCVAVKRLHKEKRRDLEETKAFVKAIRLSAPLQHPSILDFVGVTWNSLRNLCLITEYLELGDLRSYPINASSILNRPSRGLYERWICQVELWRRAGVV
ncbi:hypothetical protein PRNP1_011268 [Phytophthora ramorum]